MSKAKGGGNPSRGEIWTVDLDPTRGHEQAGQRPALIITDDALNNSTSGIVTILPVTTTRRGIPAHVEIAPPDGGIQRPSVVMVDQKASRALAVSDVGYVMHMGRVAYHGSAESLQANENVKRLFLGEVPGDIRFEGDEDEVYA